MKELDFILTSSEEDMQKTLDHLKFSFSKIRAGRPSPVILQDIMIKYYEVYTPINQITNIIVPDAMTLLIQPFDRTLIRSIEKAIINSNLGFTPKNNGENIIINLPPLTEERRKDLSKQAKTETENAKISIRNSRKDANNELKKNRNLSKDLIQSYEEKIQKLTKLYINKAEIYFFKKNSEIMKI